jgi:hypothetical protein
MEEAFRSAQAFPSKRNRYGRSFRKVLDADADRHRYRRKELGIASSSRGKGAERYSYGHSFGNVVECDRQYEQDAPFQMGGMPSASRSVC